VVLSLKRNKIYTLRENYMGRQNLKNRKPGTKLRREEILNIEVDLKLEVYE
jgi:hypothetical protein